VPVQQWYLEKEPKHVSHFNQSVLLAIDKGINESILKVVFEQLLRHHDALRFKYYQKEGAWHQVYGNVEASIIVENLQSVTNDLLSTTITDLVDKNQRSLDIEKGEVIRVVLVQTPLSSTHNRLFVVIHHLVVDGVSWRILLDDLELLLNGIKNGEKIDLGYKTSSYRQWHEALKNYGQSIRVLSQREYWQALKEKFVPIPIDKQCNERIKASDMGHYAVHLTEDETRCLLHDVPKVYHTEINDILLAAMAKTLCSWSNTESVVIGLESHGRESIDENIDTSRTVGWFTTHFPVLLETKMNADEDDLIKSVKEQLRRIPDKGIGYWVLKYLNQEKILKGKEPWDIIFNYLGQVDNVSRESKWFKAANEATGSNISEEYPVTEKISVLSSIQEDKLRLRWTYSGKHYNEETIKNLAVVYIANLQNIITHCVARGKAGVIYTPSDFRLGSEITYHELDKFLNESFLGKPRRESIQTLYRLSGLQEGMLFHALYDGTGEGYIIHFNCDLINPDLDALEESWNYIVKTHSVLRSGFYHDSFSIPVQCVYKEIKLPVTILDFRNMGAADQDLAIKEFQEQDRATGFDFKAGLLMRVSLMRLDDQRYRMLWSFHHILFDGWSRSYMMSEFLNIYEILVSGKPLPPVDEDHYEDFIRYTEQVDKEKEKSYWKNYLKSIEQSTLLPFISTTKQRNKGGIQYTSLTLDFNSQLTHRIELFTQTHRITINTLMQGVWAYLLHNYTGCNDIVYGITVSGRPTDLPKVEERVGLYINTLVLRSILHHDDSVVEWLMSIQEDQVLSRTYEHTPLHIIQGWTGVQGDLFDNLITFENYPVGKLLSSKKWALQVENVQANEQNNFPLTLIIGSDEETSIRFHYNTELMDEVFVRKIRNHFEQVLLQMIENDNGRLMSINLLTEIEKSQLLSEFNNTSTEYPTDKTIIELFEDQVRRSPEAIALVFDGKQVTYKQLDDRSNQLANFLIAKGTKPGSNIGLLSHRCVEMIIGMFGILKTGCAYVPLNTEYPRQRLNYIIENSGVSNIVYTDSQLLKSSGLEGYQCTDVKKSHLSPVGASGIKTSIDTCSYVMYTSGTTGQPKGIAVAQRNIIKLVYEVGEIAIQKSDRVLQWSNYSFDGSVYDIYSSLLKGATLCLIKDSIAFDAVELSSIIQREKITVCFMTTALFNTFIDVDPAAFKGLRKLLFGGEKVSANHVQKAFSILGAGKIIHVYGPTETTVFASYYCVDSIPEDGAVPIGKPLSNTKLLVLNPEKALVPVGVAGELYIGGDGVSLGYVNNDSLTEEKFITDSFSDNSQGRLYKTGDMVRWLGNGNIEFLGRLDQQVKIRGYRVELGEIESVLQTCHMVKQAVILTKEDKEGTKSLVAYVVPADEFDKAAVINYLQETLPEYMLPSVWVELAHLPLTTNGKIDKKALPDPDASEGLNNEYVAPRTEVELILANIWQELLDMDRVGITDNFFDLGGHSLLAIRLISSVRRELDVELPISTFFELPTILDLANYIKVTQGNGQEKLENWDTIKL
jgi:amino acid adenylation domain-containing protein/non-ribosomal peptide synthase protein (TIGR01720 family)